MNSRLRKVRRVAILKLIEVRAYAASVRYPVGHGLPPLLIFGHGRTGSTLLESLLASTGYFRSRGEVLNTDFRGEALLPLRFVDGEAKRSGDRRLLCHIKPAHLTSDRRRPVSDPSGFLQNLDDRGWHFVHISRRNKFEQLLSNLVAQQRGGYFKTDDAVEQLRITVDCDDLVDRINHGIARDEREQAMLSSIDYLPVVYEDDLLQHDRHQPTVDRILDKLNLRHRPVASEYRKVRTQTLPDLIVNYSEVSDRLHAAGLERFLSAD